MWIFLRNSHYAGVGGSLPWHHNPSGWCSGQRKVAAAVTNTPQHLSPHPKEQCNPCLQEFTKDGNRLNGETPKGRHSKGNCGVLSVPGSASWAGTEGWCPCSATSQHTQEKVTEKAVGNKEKPELEHSNQWWNSSGKQERERSLVHGIKWEHPTAYSLFCPRLTIVHLNS